MFSNDISIVDLDPIQWRNYGQFLEKLSEPRHHLVVVHRQGKLRGVYDSADRINAENLPELPLAEPSSALSVLRERWPEIEVIVVAGNSVEVRKLANRLISTRGVKHGQLSCTAAQE